MVVKGRAYEIVNVLSKLYEPKECNSNLADQAGDSSCFFHANLLISRQPSEHLIAPSLNQSSFDYPRMLKCRTFRHMDKPRLPFAGQEIPFSRDHL